MPLCRYVVVALGLLVGVLSPPPTGAIDVIITGTGTTGHVIQEETTALPAQPNLRFLGPGATCVNNSGAAATDCTFPSDLTATSTHDLANKFLVPSEFPLSIVTDTVTPDCNTAAINIVTGITAPLTVNAPACGAPKPYPSQDLTLRFFGTAPQGLTWNAAYAFTDGIPQPTAITGDGIAYNTIKFRRNSVTAKWVAMASTFPPSAPSGHTIKDETTTLAMQPTLSFLGTGVTCANNAGASATECTIPGGAGGSMTSRNLPVTGVKFNDGVNAPATPDRSGLKDFLLFDNATKMCVIWQFQLPVDYLSTPSLSLQYTIVTPAVTGGVVFEVDVWHPKAGQVLTTASYDTVNAPCITASVAGQHLPNTLACPLTNVDTWVAGESVNLRLCRAISHASDTAAGFVGLYGADLRYTR